MRLLALETTSDVCSIALVEKSETVASLSFAHEMQLSTRLIPLIDHLLRTAGWQIAEVDAYAVGLGPGSFTGTRVGVMTAKTFAQVYAKPIVGMCSLDVMAAEYTFIPHQVVCAVIPARKGEVYAGIYEGGLEVPQPVAQQAVYTLESLRDTMAPFVGGDIVLAGRLPAELMQLLSEYPVCYAPVRFARAERLAQIAYKLLEQGYQDDPLKLVPMYLKPPAITMPKGAGGTAGTNTSLHEQNGGNNA